MVEIKKMLKNRKGKKFKEWIKGMNEEERMIYHNFICIYCFLLLKK